MGGARRRRAALSGAAAAVALLIPLGAIAAELAFGLERLMGALARREASAVRFEETRHSDALRAPLVATGELRYRRPAHLERRVQTPSAERYTIDGDEVAIERGGTARTLRLDGLPVLRVFVESIRATLAGDLAALERHYAVVLSGTRERWTLALLPSDPEVAQFVTSVTIAGRDDRIERMEVLEASGDRVVTRFLDALPDAPAPPAAGRRG